MKIGIVNDSRVAVKAISDTLRKFSDHEILWTAVSGADAISLCRRERPDLILMDLLMPGLNGVQATREIMATCPTAILVVTSSVERNASLAFQAMGAGALDAISTPILLIPEGREDFLKKISQLEAIIAESQNKEVPVRQDVCGNEALIAIGSSAGGPTALAEILGDLPTISTAAIVIIQHIDVRFVEELAQWLRSQCKHPLQLVNAGDRLLPGQIYLAGKHGHLELRASSDFSYTQSPSNLAYQPSVDVFFSSVAIAWKKRALGIILTGMGRDGSQGLLAMRRAGHLTIAQDKLTSALYGMPKSAAECDAAAEILPLQKIAQRINDWMKNPQSK